jgi:hypothetical protein
MNRINWLGVIVATVAAFFIGFLWYGLIFEATWLELTGQTTSEDMSMLPMLWGLGQTFVTMFGLGWFIGRDSNLMDGLKTGLIAAVCFALMTSAYNFIYETSPTGLLPIDWSHLLVIYAVGGAIIGGLRMKPKA